MIATQIYQDLENDFVTSKMSDDWAQYMDSVVDYLCENFKKRSMGLVCDFTTKINKVYTAVFPSRAVMQRILDDGCQYAMLFVHHPSIWDIRKAPEVFQQMDSELLNQFRDRKISIYNFHVPLDHYGEHSTSVNLAKALGIKPKKPFAPYFGALAGVFGKTDAATVQDLKTIFEKAVGHKVSLYNYGDNKIKERNVAIAAGGGLDLIVIEEITENNVNVLVTGITVKNNVTKNVHEFAKKHRVNILGGTHYSTEKFACISMVGYFEEMGLPSEFIDDIPVMEDI